MKKILTLAAGLAIGAALASAGTISYTCDPSVSAATCNYLNTTVAGLYSSTFTNANADIYITYGTTGLAQTQTAFNVVSYSAYVTALAANSNMSALQISALSALNTYDSGPYGSGNVNITASLASALGLTGLTDNGVPVGSSTPCTLGASGCYNAEITVTNDLSTPLYYDNLGGTEPADAYDFYATVEHETDEVLGTSSCIDTSVSLSDGCDSFGDGTPSAADLFRYSDPGDLVLDSSLSTAAGAYFSYNGGVTNGVIGVGGNPKFYNTLANGDDYGDFVSSTPDCGTNQVVQDAEGCPGEDAGLSILNDGKGEINMLNAVGYDLQPTTATPEPGTLVLFGAGFAVLVGLKRRHSLRAHGSSM
jgi:hypothetical protein